MKKLLFFILIILFLLNINFIFSQDNTSDVSSNRAIEFSVGGGTSISYIIEGIFGENNGMIGSPILFAINVTIPISFVYHPMKYFGFGLKNAFGYDFINLYFSILNKTSFINKIGSQKKKRWFVLEYGIALKYTYPVKIISGNEGNRLEYGNPYLSIGPDLFIGHNKIRNMFSYTVGFVFTGYSKFSNSRGTMVSPSGRMGVNQEWNFHFGIEFRWRFAYFKPLKR